MPLTRTYPFPHRVSLSGRTGLALLERVWDAARDYGRTNGHEIVDTYGVVGIAPT